MAQSPIGASAGLSSATREPSMEEILASIRRIIEESDTGRPDETPPSAVNSDVPAQTASGERYEDTFDSEEAELAPRQGIAVTPPVQKMPEPAFSRPEPEVEAKAPEPAAIPDIEPEAADPVAHAPVEELLPAETLKQPVQKPVSAASQLQPTADASFHAPKSEPKLEAAVLPQLEPEATVLPEPEATVLPESEPEATVLPELEPVVIEEFETSMEEEVSLDLAKALEPILSESTERQVSAAFEDLSFAVRSEQRRSFDEIAQEIMRPLLQDWLDNNLPNLVERLVREEIERVARGGKR